MGSMAAQTSNCPDISGRRVGGSGHGRSCVAGAGATVGRRSDVCCRGGQQEGEGEELGNSWGDSGNRDQVSLDTEAEPEAAAASWAVSRPHRSQAHPGSMGGSICA